MLVSKRNGVPSNRSTMAKSLKLITRNDRIWGSISSVGLISTISVAFLWGVGKWRALIRARARVRFPQPRSRPLRPLQALQPLPFLFLLHPGLVAPLRRRPAFLPNRHRAPPTWPAAWQHPGDRCRRVAHCRQRTGKPAPAVPLARLCPANQPFLLAYSLIICCRIEVSLTPPMVMAEKVTVPVGMEPPSATPKLPAPSTDWMPKPGSSIATAPAVEVRRP